MFANNDLSTHTHIVVFDPNIFNIDEADSTS